MTRPLLSFCLTALTLFAPLQARRGQSSLTITPSMDSSITQLAGQYRDIDTLVEQANRQVADEQRKADREIQSLEGRMHRRQSRIEKRRQEALRREAEARAELEMQTRAQAEKVAKEAEARALEIVQQAERRALVLRDKLREQDAQDRANSRPKITTDWRREVTSEFDADTAFMRRVVMQGEASRIERDNFSILFEEQKKWFEGMLKKVMYFFDDNYSAVMRKKNDLASLVDAQRQADEVILDLVDRHHLSDAVKAQLRLQAMYEINNHLQTVKRTEVFLPVDIIHELVGKVTGEVAPGQREIKIVTEKQRITELEQRIADLESQLEEAAAYAGAEQTPLEVSGGADAGLFDTVQDALQADRKATQERISSLEKAKEDELSALEQKKEEEIATIKHDADAQLTALTQEKQSAEGKQHRRDEKHAAQIQERIDQLRAEKKEAVVNAQKVAKLRIDELKKKHQKMMDGLHEQRNTTVGKIKEQLTQLREERKKSQEKLLNQQVKLTTERARAQKLSTQLTQAKGTVTTLRQEVSGLQEEQEKLRLRHKQERNELVRRIEQRQRDKVEMEIALAQVKQQLTVLSTSSSTRLLSLASELSTRVATQSDLTRLLERKARQQVELEIGIAQAQEQLGALASESEEVLTSAAGQLAHYEHRCDDLHRQLTNKQDEVVSLESAMQYLQEMTQQSIGQSTYLGQQAAQQAQQNEHLQEQIIELQRALQVVRMDVEASEDKQPQIDRLQALLAQTRAQVVSLVEQLQQKYYALQHRKGSFDRMEHLQHQLHRLRQSREYDVERDAQHAELLARMAAFGEQVVGEHDNVAQATHQVQYADEQLAQLSELLTEQGEVPEALGSFEQVLDHLGQAAQVSDRVAMPPRNEVIAPTESRQAEVALHEEEEEEEAPHEPDEHPEEPEVVDTQEGETADLDVDLESGDGSLDADVDMSELIEQADPVDPTEPAEPAGPVEQADAIVPPSKKVAPTDDEDSDDESGDSDDQSDDDDDDIDVDAKIAELDRELEELLGEDK